MATIKNVKNTGFSILFYLVIRNELTNFDSLVLHLNIGKVISKSKLIVFRNTFGVNV